MTSLIDFRGALKSRDPYPHCVFSQVFTPAAADVLLKWLEEASYVHRHVPDFYDTYETRLDRGGLPDEVQRFADEDTIEALGLAMGDLFEATLAPKVEVTAHKMVPGFRVGVHTDHGPAAQSYRLLVQLNRGWVAKQGGWLMVLNEQHPGSDTKARAIVPRPGVGFAFEISTKSYHAVTPVISGERYTLCYSFRKA
jgi:hypothetical protein